MPPVLILVALVVLLAAVAPTWPHSRNYGWAPTSVLALLVLVVLFALLTGRL